MGKIALNLIALAVLLGTSILVMIHGWGLEAKSWGWILGGTLAGLFIAAVLKAVAEIGD